MLKLKVEPTQTDIDAILSLPSTKKFLRIIDTEEDETIQENILSAISEAEGLTNRQFAKATYELYLENFPRGNFKFPKNPINEIVSIEYMDLEGNYQLLDSSTYYLYKLHEVGKVEFEEYPNVQVKRHKQAVRITFKSGYATNFPADLRQWLKVRVSTLFEYREELTAGVSIAKNDHVDSILQRYRIRS